MADIDKGGGRKYFRAIYRDAKGVRRFKSTKCTDARAAQIAANRIEREAQDPVRPAENPTTLTQALEHMIGYFEEQLSVGKRSAGTLDMHRWKSGHLKRVIDPDGTFILARTGARHVDDYISTRRADGADENTIAKELVTLRVTLKLAKRRGDWHGDPAAILPIRFAPEYKPRTRYLQPAEIGKVMSEMSGDHAARLAFAVATSANLGETCAARREDISEGFVFVRGTKRTSRLRTVPLILPWQRKLIDFAKANARGRDGKLFAFDGGCENALKQACLDAKVPACSSNDLRRTFCHWMRASGIPRELVAAAMGHGSTAMVDKVYGKLDAQELATAMAKALGTDTTVAQTNAESMDSSDESDSTRDEKLNDLVPEEGLEPTHPLRYWILSPSFALPSPRENKRNRKYPNAADTHGDTAKIVTFPRRRRA